MIIKLKNAFLILGGIILLIVSLGFLTKDIFTQIAFLFFAVGFALQGEEYLLIKKRKTAIFFFTVAAPFLIVTIIEIIRIF